MARAQTQLKRISVDLTPVRPGGENGGAKPLARTLVRELGRLAPETQFTLLTNADTHAELAELDAPNVQRQCVDADLAIPLEHNGSLSRARLTARTLVNSLVPSETARQRIKDQVWTMVKRRRRSQVATSLLADLLFCPFTAPFFFDPRVPLVSLVHDLQFLYLPQFFDAQQRQDRHRHFLDACQRADRLICVSEFVRQTVLNNSDLPPERAQTIHSAALNPSSADPEADALAGQTIGRLGVRGARYLLYPANVWPHKNHAVLLDALARYRTHQPQSDLALVCTGAPSPAAEALQAQAQRVLPPGSFAFAGYVSAREFGALLRRSRALVFPSLYEGFGLPILEAMASDVPVLCSNTTSLPEVAGDAALLFDPHNAAALAGAIEQLETQPALGPSLVQRGRVRVAQFGGAREMAARYLAAFEQVAAARAS